MAYNIITSSGASLSVSELNIDRRFSPSLIGKSTISYVSDFNQTILQLCENYASVDSPETNPYVNFDNDGDLSTNPRISLVGQLWYDYHSESLKVYSTKGTWESVSADVTTRNLIPEFDGEIDLGDEEHYWHNIYVTHMNLSANNFLNQQNIADPDNIPPITIDGNILLGAAHGQTNNFNFDSEYRIGTPSEPFQLAVTNTILFGTEGKCGLKYSQNDTIEPITNPVGGNAAHVSMGITANPLLNTCATTVYTDRIIPMDGSTIRVNSASLSPSITNTTDLGTSTDKLGEVYSDNLSVTSIKKPSEGFNVSDIVSKELHKLGFKSVPNGSVSTSTEIVVEKNDNTYAAIPYYDVLPEGSIFVWGLSIDEIPYGWHICDGTNGTPNLKNRFVVGTADLTNIGEISSSTTVTSSYDGETNQTTGSAGTHNHTGFTKSTYLDDKHLPAHTHIFDAQYQHREDEGSGKHAPAYHPTNYPLTNGTTTASAVNRSSHRHKINEEPSHTHSLHLEDHDHEISLNDVTRYEAIYIMKVI